MSEKTQRKLDLPTIIGIALIVGMIVAAFAIDQHRDARMTAYAEENNCEWHYDYYFNKEPVCK